MWRRFATVAIVQNVVVANHLRMLTDPRLHPTRCRLFRRVRVLVVRDRTRPKRLDDRCIQRGFHDERTASFIVTDLTHISRQNLWKVQKCQSYILAKSLYSRRKKTHFDTNHMVIPWNLEYPDESAKKLTTAIRATPIILPACPKLFRTAHANKLAFNRATRLFSDRDIAYLCDL